MSLNQEWDWKNSGDWVLQKFIRSEMEVTLRFSAGGPSVQELMSVRRCLPQFRHQSPDQVRTACRTGKLELGVLSTLEARRLCEALQREGLQFDTTGRTTVGYMPVDRSTNMILLIELEAESARVVEEMLEAGVPVEDCLEE